MSFSKNIQKIVLIVITLFFVLGIKNVLAVDNFQKIMDIDDMNELVSGDESIVNIGNITYFIYSTGEYGSELWRTDGTSAGTYMVKDINPGSNDGAEQIFNIGNTIYMAANDGVYGRELWKSDGTEAGTVLVKDINPSPGESIYNPFFVNYNNILYFNAMDLTHGWELWRSDGTTAGTYMVKDLRSGIDSSSPLNAANSYAIYNGILYFSANKDANNQALWRTDGTEDGTYMVFDYDPEAADNFEPTQFVVYDNKLYFSGNYDSFGGGDLWVTDGTREGTSLFADLNGVWGSNPKIIGIFDGKLYFSAEDNYDVETGRELWVTDGTEKGTHIVSDINPGAENSNPDYGIVYNNKLYFTADDGVHGGEIWVMDNSFTKPHLFADLDSSEGSSIYWPKFKNFNGKLYFLALTWAIGPQDAAFELWNTDGTEEGTKLVGTHLAIIMGFTVMYGNNNIYALIANGYEESDGFNYWASDLELDVYKPIATTTYTVTFKDYNGNVLKTQKVNDGSNATSPINPSRIGYTFVGWDKTFNHITGNLIVTAQYSINTYTVTFKDYDGKVLKTQNVNYGNKALTPSNPTREGYIFTGWSKNYSNITANLTVTALYRIYQSNNQNDGNVEPELVVDNITINLNQDDEDKINNNIKVIGGSKDLINVYDVNLILNGEKIQPDGYIEIRILMTEEQKEYHNLQVIYIDDKNNVTVIPHTIDGDYIVFSVNHLSKYAVIGEKNTTDESVDEPKDVEKANNSTLWTIIPCVSLWLVLIILWYQRRRKNKKS